MQLELDRRVGEESRKTYNRKVLSGFMKQYLFGKNILEIGYKGYDGTELTIVPQAVGIDLDYPGYNGVHLPFEDQSQDAIYNSHTLEHIRDVSVTLKEWFRVLKVGGYLIIAVPHYQLYEKKRSLPSRYNGDHKRMYHAGSLLNELHDHLPFGEWRLRYCQDNDYEFDYSLPCDVHSVGCYETECVIQKIQKPLYIDQMKEI